MATLGRMTSVLMAVTAARHWTLKDGTKHPTGYWAEELVIPYRIFTEAGYDITIATPSAIPPVADELSLSVKGGMLPHFAKEMRNAVEELQPVLSKPADLHAVNVDDYDLVFFPGGHGPMEDLAVDKQVGALLIRRFESGRPLALLCHAPAALLSTLDAEGRTPFEGLKITGFSNAEEVVNPFARKAKWLLEDRLLQSGLDYTKGLPFTSKVVVDRCVFTGQNQKSAKELASLLVDVLG